MHIRVCLDAWTKLPQPVWHDRRLTFEHAHAVNLRYEYEFELYITDGRPIAPNTCTVESGTNTEGCPIKYGVSPALPPGLTLGEN